MRHRDAVDLLKGANLDASWPSTWVDLGSGDGTFTTALADLLGPGSVIYAIDYDADALKRIPPHPRVRIEAHAGDFIEDSWPVSRVDGILMTNSLHYIDAPRAFLEKCLARLNPGGVFLVVEYDTDRANPWVPHPVSSARLAELYNGLGTVAVVGSRPSIYRRAPLYAAVVRPRCLGRRGRSANSLQSPER